MRIFINVLKAGEPGFINVPQYPPEIPRVNDIYIYDKLAWRVTKVAHSANHVPLVYLGEPRALTETEREYFT